MNVFNFVLSLLAVCVQVYIDVRVPKKGEYGLEIFANDPQKEGDMFTHVCQYLCFYIDGRAEDLYGSPRKEALTDELDAAEMAETGKLSYVYICLLLYIICDVTCFSH